MVELHIKLLWYTDFNLVPIRGICLYQNKWYWYELTDHLNKSVYFIYDIPLEFIKYEQKKQICHRRYIGCNNDFRHDGSSEKEKTSEMYKYFNDLYGNDELYKTYTDYPLIGYATFQHNWRIK